MRLFLDAHVSGRRIATALREQHDVRAADEESELDRSEDERLLALATEQGRVMVTFNVKDFARITTEWAAAGRSHAGCLLIVGIDHAEFGLNPAGDPPRPLNPGRTSLVDRLHRLGHPISSDMTGPACATGLPLFGRGRRSGGRKPEGVNQRTDPVYCRQPRPNQAALSARGRIMDRAKLSRTSTSETNRWL